MFALRPEAVIPYRALREMRFGLAPPILIKGETLSVRQLAPFVAAERVESTEY
jgi:hypothetical protein